MFPLLYLPSAYNCCSISNRFRTVISTSEVYSSHYILTRNIPYTAGFSSFTNSRFKENTVLCATYAHFKVHYNIWTKWRLLCSSLQS